MYRYPHIEKDHLVKLLKQLLLNKASLSPGMSTGNPPNAADVPTLLGRGSFSLLSCTCNLFVLIIIMTLNTFGFPYYCASNWISFACLYLYLLFFSLLQMTGIKWMKKLNHHLLICAGLIRKPIRFMGFIWGKSGVVYQDTTVHHLYVLHAMPLPNLLLWYRRCKTSKE